MEVITIQIIGGDKDVSTISITPVNNQAYTFLPNGKTTVGYTKATLNDVDNQTYIYLVDKSTSPHYYNPYGVSNRSGQKDIAHSDTSKTYYFSQLAYNSRISLKSDLFTVPAFALPTSATATYDTLTQSVKLNWSIRAVTDANFVNDKFKIQYATQPDFSDATNISADYAPAKAKDSIIIKNNLAPLLYFRLARDHPSFEWELAQTVNLPININSIHTNTLSLAVQNNTAVLKWGALQSAWVPGASFVITRTNNTTKTQTTFTLAKADFLKGTYTDNQIAVCNQYAYTLQILPPANSAFATPALVTMPGIILLTQIGSINDLNVSKGYFPDRTEISWSSLQGVFDNFIVKRAVYGSTNFVQLGQVAGGGAGDYEMDDTKGTPGIYYTYQVTGVIQCNNAPAYSDTLAGVGFRSPTGNIYGRVTYQNGQAVQNVGVRLANSDNSNMGKSILLNGSPKSYLNIDTLNTPFADTAFTFEAWVKPTDAAPINQVLFSSGTQYQFGFDNNGHLYFLNGSDSVTGNYKNINQTFIHVAGIRKKDSLLIMLNDSVIATKAKTALTNTTTRQQVYLGSNGDFTKNYKGFIDETRIWNIAKTPAIIARDYTRLITGGEPGLVAYWRFDEIIKNQFYDLSHAGDNYNQNDGSMDSASVTRSVNIPTAGQLSLNGLTDSTGNYLISGIPYTGNGITYSIVPILGTHQFDPVSANRLISATSNVFTVDFKDKSAFLVQGKVTYGKGTFPVSGVQFKIDGLYAQNSDGTFIVSGTDGVFHISVPVGYHSVQCFLYNHVFADSGKILLKGQNLNYQVDVTGLKLQDNTTIRLIGRVAGGAIQGAFPLGHSLSKNNLGSVNSIVIGVPGTAYSFLPTGATQTETDTVPHFLPSDKKLNTLHQTTVVYDTLPQNNITIYPDSVTGEFAADLIPISYTVESVSTSGRDFGTVTQPLDLTSQFIVNNSINSYKDSVSIGNTNSYTYTNYTDTVPYNAMYKKIYRENPTITISQIDVNNNPLSYFGDLSYTATNLTGQSTIINLINPGATGINQYIFGSHPVFSQGVPYNFKVNAFESYPYCV